MTLTELRYIVALARERHFSRAADACFVSQPTLSVAVAKLETSLGVALFERLNNEIKITTIGEKIVAQAQRVLEEAEGVKALAAENKDQLKEPLRLGAIYTVAPYLFPTLIPALRKTAKDMPLIIQEDFTKNLRKKIQTGELDAIFVALPFTEKNVVTRPVYEEPFVALLPKNHALSKNDTVNEKDLKKENVLLLGEGHCFRDNVLEACPSCLEAKGDHPVIEGTSLETLRHMVASGMGITILPITATQVKHYHNTLCTKPFAGKAPKRTIALAWRNTFPRPKAIEAVIEALVACDLQGICVMEG